MAVAARAAAAQEAPIADNSFLVEEAYNQEPRVVQHVGTLNVAEEGGGWSAGFTQEWPAPSQRHQLSFSLAEARIGEESGFGDLALHYRYQLRGLGDDAVAIAPRVSLILPTGDAERGLGWGAFGVQFNLPVSVELAPRWVGHWNAGASWFPDAEAVDGSEADVSVVTVAQGLVWLARPRFNVLLEAAWTTVAAPVAGGSEREETWILSPGVRFAVDRPSGLQIVPGLAVPIGLWPSDLGVFLYLSFEHPF